VAKDFVIQGGDPQGTGMGGPGYSIRGEFSSNGVANDISHTRGVISMARSDDPDSAGSQFFIVQRSSIFLNGNYAGFGRVLTGLDVVDAIADTATNLQTERPLTDQVIASIRVDTFGTEYGEPEKLP
jgi:peptidyl-prolyl cis-trans isomerase B (cyclophilin B)